MVVVGGTHALTLIVDIPLYILYGSLDGGSTTENSRKQHRERLADGRRRGRPPSRRKGSEAPDMVFLDLSQFRKLFNDG
jgi:hypothetical protein